MSHGALILRARKTPEQGRRTGAGTTRERAKRHPKFQIILETPLVAETDVYGVGGFPVKSVRLEIRWNFKNEHPRHLFRASHNNAAP